MCGTCGCSDGTATITAFDADGPKHGHDHPHHHHGHTHTHDHDHGPQHRHGDGGSDHTHSHAHAHADASAVGERTTIRLQEDVLAKNRALAERNRGWFMGRNILALNLVSSPGSGKTTLLERTIEDLKGSLPISVIEGDQQTLNDAMRIRATGAPVVQINTGAACHLEADMIARALAQLRPPPESVLMIENVGNLVCPAMFDLGEHAKVAILSVTEGDDKPAKYPNMISASDLLLINKIDLLPHVDFDMTACIGFARRVNPDIEVLQVSARTGEGMGAWCDWVRHRRQAVEALALV